MSVEELVRLRAARVAVLRHLRVTPRTTGGERLGEGTKVRAGVAAEDVERDGEREEG
jgi:hypothetical protein